MTTHAAPLNVNRWQTDTTVMSVDASGSASFAQGANFGGAVVVSGAMGINGEVSAAATVKVVGPTARLQVGGSAADTADVILCRQVDISGNATKKQTTIPNGADILDITMFIQTPPSSSALSTTDVLVGVTAQDTRFARFANVTAQGFYRAVTSTRTSGWLSVSGANAILQISVTAVSGAIASAAAGRVNIFYVKRQ